MKEVFVEYVNNNFLQLILFFVMARSEKEKWYEHIIITLECLNIPKLARTDHA